MARKYAGRFCRGEFGFAGAYPDVRELVERVRWGNVARLCAVVAAALLVAVGTRAGSYAGGGAAPLPPHTRATPPPPIADAPPEATPRKHRTRPRPTHKHRRTK